MIHIAYCLDDGFVEPTCVSMASVLANTSAKVSFHIVYRSLSDENISKFKQLCVNFPNGECFFYAIEVEKYLSSFVLWKTSHFTIESYFRLLLHLIIKNTKRLIYLDGDTIVNDDIQKLWDEDLQGKAIGAVKDIWTRDPKLLSPIMNFDVEKKYFNAGVLLIDLEKFASVFPIESVLIELEQLYSRFCKDNIPWYADQEILNYIGNGKSEVCFLPAKYNYQQNDFDQYIGHISYGQNCSTLEEWKAANCNPVIIHFDGPHKPWKISRRIKYTTKNELFYHYKDLTPYKNEQDGLIWKEYERRRQLTKTEALMEPSMFVSMFWKDILNDAAQSAKQKVGSRKIAFWGAGNHMKHVVSVFAFNDLMPDVLVDGFEKKQGQRVFEYTVESPDVILEHKQDYFIVLSMETIRGRDAVLKILDENGYTEQDFIVVYQEVFDFDKEPLI